MSSNIKCRYTASVCCYGRKVWPVCWGECDRNDDCEDSEFENGSDRCVNVYKARREFEKTVKSYELDECELKIGRKIIDTDDIDYLEIDGRVIYDEVTE